MADILLWAIAGLVAIACALLAVLLARFSSKGQEAQQSGLREELRAAREESNRAARDLREEITKNLQGMTQGMTTQSQRFVETNQVTIDRLRNTIDERLKGLQEGNERKLDEMRKTVDEKLHDTLEKRLGESFKLVSQHLEAVQRGLGEMKILADGVGDLKRVLTNVKTRGTWGEVQLGAILEQVMNEDQYAKNVQTKDGSGEMVEYAIRLPGPDRDPAACIWLPIDSKFPQEDYLRLSEAAEKGDQDGVQRASAELARSIRKAAKDVSEKYLDPPRTTDFALLFLPTEGLYAEVLRHPGLVEELQRAHRVVLSGPTTLAAILNSLHMGFRTLAIEKRASEVWKVLAAVKTEFGKFGGVLDKVKKQLNSASRTIEETGVRTRAMEKRLREVEQLPGEEAEKVLELSGADEDPDDEDETEEEI